MSDLQNEGSIRIAALYRFARIEDREAVQTLLRDVCEANGIFGTLLVAHEGLNGTVAGPDAGIDALLAAIHALPGFETLEVKFARTDTMPFYRMKVRLKSEIVTLGEPGVDPVGNVGEYVSPTDWNRLIADPETLVIDTRNDYEGEIGEFAGAVQPNTPTFRDFPAWFRTEGRALMEETGAKRVAMYCTGGIRCEKSTAFLKSEGIDEVFHLKGGILNYLETVDPSESLWNGECFVFDERVSVGHGLVQGDHTLCRGCRTPVSAEGRQSPLYVEGVCCERCHDSRDDSRKQAYAERQRQVELARARGEAHIGKVQTRTPRTQDSPAGDD